MAPGETSRALEPDTAADGLGLSPSLVLRLLLLLHVGGGLVAPVLVVDLDDLFAGRLIAALRLRRWLRFRPSALATGHSQTLHPTRSSDIQSAGQPAEQPQHRALVTSRCEEFSVGRLDYTYRLQG